MRWCIWLERQAPRESKRISLRSFISYFRPQGPAQVKKTTDFMKAVFAYTGKAERGEVNLGQTRGSVSAEGR